MDNETWDSLYEISREKHREYVDRGLDDSCAATPTLNSFVRLPLFYFFIIACHFLVNNIGLC